jgi:hypothetical protein
MSTTRQRVMMAVVLLMTVPTATWAQEGDAGIIMIGAILTLALPRDGGASVPEPSDSGTAMTTAAEVPVPPRQQTLSIAASAAPNEAVEAVYFTPQDEDTSCTVLILHNTGDAPANVGLQTFALDGTARVNTTIDVPAHNLVRVCTDPVSTSAPSWATTLLINFMTYSVYGKLTLPAGVKVDGYVVWNFDATYDPTQEALTLGLRFSSEPGSSVPGTTGETLYFHPQDEATSATVLFLYNTSDIPATVGLQTFTNDGTPVVNKTISVPARNLVRICSDPVWTFSTTWLFTALHIDLGSASAAGKLVLPPGVKVEGYVVWNNGDTYNPCDGCATLSLRFNK